MEGSAVCRSVVRCLANWNLIFFANLYPLGSVPFLIFRRRHNRRAEIAQEVSCCRIESQKGKLVLPISFDDIGPTDIVRLIDYKTSERRTLEYKEKLSIGSIEEKAEFLADISSFANASGGDIIFGISDERESGKATGIPGKIVSLQIGNPSSEQARIEQLVESGIEPRIPLVQVKTVSIPEISTVIIVRVGKSWIAPHMVSYSNRTRFFSRSGTGKVQLDVQQIGAAFAQQRSLGPFRGRALFGDGPFSGTGPFRGRTEFPLMPTRPS
jgi:hypothetical protein